MTPSPQNTPGPVVELPPPVSPVLAVVADPVVSSTPVAVDGAEPVVSLPAVPTSSRVPVLSDSPLSVVPSAPLESPLILAYFSCSSWNAEYAGE